MQGIEAMKQTVYDVLMYLFEYFLADDEVEQDPDRVQAELVDAGFGQREIHKAFQWLEELGKQVASGENLCMVSSNRIFTKEEQHRLSCECRGVLLMLEQRGVLDMESREAVIDRALALEADEVSLEQLEWVILMVLFYSPHESNQPVWEQEMVHRHLTGFIH